MSASRREFIPGVDPVMIEEAIFDGLEVYQDMIHDRFRIDRTQASILGKCAVGGPLSGLWASTTAIYGTVDDGPYAMLDIAVLPQGEGTGNRSVYGPENTDPGHYSPDTLGIYPLHRPGVLAEVILSIATIKGNALRKHAMHLDKIGITDGILTTVATIGQSSPQFQRIVEGTDTAEPQAVFTIKQYDIEGLEAAVLKALEPPEAIYNNTQLLQIAARLSISHGVGNYQKSIFPLLGAQLPTPPTE